MLKTKKIWFGDRNGVDTYTDFFGKFNCENRAGDVILKITCDSAFTFTINGEKVFFASVADYPDQKKYYKFDITKFCKEKNEFKITVWHHGFDTQTYINAEAFLAFTITCNDMILSESNCDILACRNVNYKSGYQKLITTQLGFSYLYDNTAENTSQLENCYECGEVVAKQFKIKPLTLLGIPKFSISEIEGGYQVDLKRETVGYLDLEIYSEKEQKILISYGEHLVNGKVARLIHGRDFSVEIILKKGINKVFCPFRRLAGRYLEVYGEDLSVKYAVIRPAKYPSVKKTVKISGDLEKKIYDTCVYTLECCMHEHYEDCPWREQALYTMDSRNQMLCGYYAFKGFSFQRENLLLMAQGLRSDGILSLCFPAGIDKPIPFFTLVYPIQVFEYIAYSKDESILKKVKPVLQKIKQTFDEKVGNNGLIEAFSGDCWNFYEWTAGSDHCADIEHDVKGRYDLILNCFYVYATSFLDRLLGVTTDLENTRKAIKDTFYNSEKRLYKLDNKTENYSVLGNAFALLIGLGDKELADRIIEDKTLVPITLSMKTFLYDALLSLSSEYAQFIKEDIKKTYAYMLEKDATTFWETLVGAEDFGGAGSLCHGWSALPIYYYNLFGIAK